MMCAKDLSSVLVTIADLCRCNALVQTEPTDNIFNCLVKLLNLMLIQTSPYTNIQHMFFSIFFSKFIFRDFFVISFSNFLVNISIKPFSSIYLVVAWKFCSAVASHYLKTSKVWGTACSDFLQIFLCPSLNPAALFAAGLYRWLFLPKHRQTINHHKPNPLPCPNQYIQDNLCLWQRINYTIMIRSMFMILTRRKCTGKNLRHYLTGENNRLGISPLK